MSFVIFKNCRERESCSPNWRAGHHYSAIIFLNSVYILFQLICASLLTVSKLVVESDKFLAPVIVLQPPLLRGGGCARSAEKGAQNEKYSTKNWTKKGEKAKNMPKNGEKSKTGPSIFETHINFAYIWSILKTYQKYTFRKGCACRFKIVKQIFLMLILECIKSARTSASYPLYFAHPNP